MREKSNMQNINRTGLFFFLVLLLASCSGDDDYTAYFGGEVDDPRIPYVILSRNDKIVDTLRLDSNNRFFARYDSLTPGLYSFRHEPDYQYVYFDRNDSLMVYINSADFDGSIVFSGRGDRKNNFLMELSLLNEEDRNKSYNIYDLGFADFMKAIDSTHNLRKTFYEKNRQEIGWSEGFDFYAKNRVDLNYYTKREYYPYIHARRTGNEVASALPEDFYSHRNTIEFNNPNLTGFSPFMRYLSAMLNNMAITGQQKGPNTEENALTDNIVKLRIADSIFTDESIKNKILSSIAFNYLLEDQNIANNRDFLEQYMEYSTDDSDTNEIMRIAKAAQQLKTGKELPRIALVNRDNEVFDYKKGIQKETVIFFWTTCARSRMEAMFNRIAQLKDKHPDTDFIAVNVDAHNEWQKMADAVAAHQVKQLRALSLPELRNKWVFTKINRTIIVNPDGTIKNAFTDLMDTEFSQHLK